MAITVLTYASETKKKTTKETDFFQVKLTLSFKRKEDLCYSSSGFEVGSITRHRLVKEPGTFAGQARESGGYRA